jgi:hypothetical protein
MCMARPEAVSRAKPGQNRPGQTGGLVRALAWPAMRPSQSQAVRPRLWHSQEGMKKWSTATISCLSTITRSLPNSNYSDSTPPSSTHAQHYHCVISHAWITSALNVQLTAMATPDHGTTVPLGRNNYCSAGVKVETDQGYHSR